MIGLLFVSFFKPIKQVLRFESLSEFALQKSVPKHYSGPLGSGLVLCPFLPWLSPWRLAFANIQSRLSCGRVTQEARAPAVVRRPHLSQLLLAIG